MHAFGGEVLKFIGDGVLAIFPIGERDPSAASDAALRADRVDRAHQVLVGAHAPGDAVHDYAETNGFHVVTPDCSGCRRRLRANVSRCAAQSAS